MRSHTPRSAGTGRTRSLAAMVAASVLVLGACDEQGKWTEPTGPVVDVVIATLPLNEPMAELLIGTTRQLIAGPVNEEGHYVAGQTVTWSSSNDAVVEVSPTGVATARTSGNVTITASAGGATGEIEMKVRFPVGQVAVAPTGQTIRREGGLQLTATVTDQSGIVRTNRTVAWTSSNPAVATVSSSGFVSGVTDGTVQISATSEGVAGQATVTVFGSPVVATVTVTPTNTGLHAIGQTRQFTAVARAGSGTVIGDAVITWATSASAVATVSPTGLATVVGAGDVTISATVNEITGPVVGNSSFAASAAVSILPTGGPQAVPNISANGILWYVVNVPSGTTSFNVSIGGGTGDADIYVLAPRNTLPGGPPNANTGQFADATWICRPWAPGSTESCTITNPVVGNYLVGIHAWPGEGAVSGLGITHTRTP